MEFDKKLLRKEIILKRQLLSQEAVSQKSTAIFDKVVNLNEFRNSRLIMAYMDFKNEVMTRNFIDNCLKSGKRIVVPVVAYNSVRGMKEIIASEISDMEKDFQISTFGIREPVKDKIKKIEPEEIDFVVVPGTVFDNYKNRIGYGAGYYDRFLGNVRGDCLKAGVAFEVQIIDKIPAESHDIPMDVIITEDRIIR